MADELEKRFDSMMRVRVGEWMRDRASVESFILDSMTILVSRGKVPIWAEFSHTSAWGNISGYFSREDKKVFMDIWMRLFDKMNQKTP